MKLPLYGYLSYRPGMVMFTVALLIASVLKENNASVDGGTWIYVDGFQSVTNGLSHVLDSVEDCAAFCNNTMGCVQFSFSRVFYKCFYSNLTTWNGINNINVVSACVDQKVERCGSRPLPATANKRHITWSVPGAPNTSAPECGYQTLSEDVAPVGVAYHAVPEIGMYNHAAMMDYHNGTFFLSWKNSPLHEDEPGQRILYASSYDGLNWTKTDGNNILFPNMSTNSLPVALFAGPTVILNGKRYASASPHQFCLFPYPYVGDDFRLLLRRVSSGVPPQFGDVFWAALQIPPGFEEASHLNSIKTLSQMDFETRADIELLNDWHHLPCSSKSASCVDAPKPPLSNQTRETLKCEACQDRCDNFLWHASSLEDLGGSNEETHFRVPNSLEEIILHRTGSDLSFTYRPNATYDWSLPKQSGIPDAGSNINAGQLPDGRVFLTSNACPMQRYPLVLSTSEDGYHWTKAVAVLSCHQLRGMSSICRNGSIPRLAYPQAVTVLQPQRNRGVYVVVSVNKEDIYTVRVPFEAL
eukprot:gene224-3603_t